MPRSSPLRPAEPTPVHIELSVRLSNGHFDTSVALPIDADPLAKEAAVKAWFGFIEAALRVHQSMPKGADNANPT